MAYVCHGEVCDHGHMFESFGSISGIKKKEKKSRNSQAGFF